MAIAYYIFYQQRHHLLSSVGPDSNYAARYLLPFSLDPTFEARLLKERSFPSASLRP